jgi:hypothetical protein
MVVTVIRQPRLSVAERQATASLVDQQFEGFGKPDRVRRLRRRATIASRPR